MKLESLFPKDFIVSEKEKREKLKSFYRYVKKCNKCNESYGTDSDNKRMITCPECDSKKRIKSMKKNRRKVY